MLFCETDLRLVTYYLLVVYYYRGRGDAGHVFFFNDTATTEIYTRSLVGSVRCV